MQLGHARSRKCVRSTEIKEAEEATFVALRDHIDVDDLAVRTEVVNQILLCGIGRKVTNKDGLAVCICVDGRARKASIDFDLLSLRRVNDVRIHGEGAGGLGDEEEGSRSHSLTGILFKTSRKLETEVRLRPGAEGKSSGKRPKYHASTALTSQLAQAVHSGLIAFLVLQFLDPQGRRNDEPERPLAASLCSTHEGAILTTDE